MSYCSESISSMDCVPGTYDRKEKEKSSQNDPEINNEAKEKEDVQSKSIPANEKIVVKASQIVLDSEDEEDEEEKEVPLQEKQILASDRSTVKETLRNKDIVNVFIQHVYSAEMKAYIKAYHGYTNSLRHVERLKSTYGYTTVDNPESVHTPLKSLSKVPTLNFDPVIYPEVHKKIADKARTTAQYYTAVCAFGYELSVKIHKNSMDTTFREIKKKLNVAVKKTFSKGIFTWIQILEATNQLLTTWKQELNIAMVRIDNQNTKEDEEKEKKAERFNKKKEAIKDTPTLTLKTIQEMINEAIQHKNIPHHKHNNDKIKRLTSRKQITSNNNEDIYNVEFDPTSQPRQRKNNKSNFTRNSQGRGRGEGGSGEGGSGGRGGYYRAQHRQQQSHHTKHQHKQGQQKQKQQPQQQQQHKHIEKQKRLPQHQQRQQQLQQQQLQQRQQQHQKPTYRPPNFPKYHQQQAYRKLQTYSYNQPSYNNSPHIQQPYIQQQPYTYIPQQTPYSNSQQLKYSYNQQQPYTHNYSNYTQTAPYIPQPQQFNYNQQHQQKNTISGRW